jgi:hypothetical protein
MASSGNLDESIQSYAGAFDITAPLYPITHGYLRTLLGLRIKQQYQPQ